MWLNISELSYFFIHIQQEEEDEYDGNAQTSRKRALIDNVSDDDDFELPKVLKVDDNDNQLSSKPAVGDCVRTTTRTPTSHPTNDPGASTSKCIVEEKDMLLLRWDDKG